MRLIVSTTLAGTHDHSPVSNQPRHRLPNNTRPAMGDAAQAIESATPPNVLEARLFIA
jgi:hypothetical protein